jgi:cbb3-type cytochrome oxidase subunit 3
MSTLPFDPSCPLGGSWYVCGSGSKSKFVGCCGSDPCSPTSNGCTAGNLYPASFNASAYGTFADQECSAGLFYTCSATHPPFLGCCKSNPCAQGSCPQTDLASSFLSSDPGKAADFLPKASAIASSTSSTSSATGTSMPLTETHADRSLSTGAIVGIAIGAVLLIGGLTGALMYMFGRRRRDRRDAERVSRLASKQDFDSTSTTPQMAMAPYPRDGVAKQYSPYTGSLAHEPFLGSAHAHLKPDTFAGSPPSSLQGYYGAPSPPPPFAAHYKYSNSIPNNSRYPPVQSEPAELSAYSQTPAELSAAPDVNSPLMDDASKYNHQRRGSGFSF